VIILFSDLAFVYMGVYNYYTYLLLPIPSLPHYLNLRVLEIDGRGRLDPLTIVRMAH